MAKVKVEKATPEKLEKLNVESWGKWSCEKCMFDWEYDEQETAYLYEGEVEVITQDGDKVSFGAGDIVTFPQGLRCTWNVSVPVRKRFKFE